MTALNKQALREELEICSKDRMRRIALALLDELEAKDITLSARDYHFDQDAARIESLEKSLEAAEKRIAELETRTVTLPPKEHDNGTDSQVDINAGFANRMWQKCADAIRAAGIGVKGE